MSSPYLFVDTVAYAYLQNEPECQLGDQNVKICGYEAYLVEQWACERRSNSVVCSYTGNTSNSVTANILKIPENRQKWGPVLQDFMETMSHNHLLTKETPEGKIFIANLSSFPSNKTLIPLDSNFFKGINKFFINENLRRLNCMGRMAVTLHSPSDATRDNFYGSFNIPKEIPTNFAIKELVTLVQISLFYCGLLEGKYVDGFLCDYTQKAAQEWWRTFGQSRHGHVPSLTSPTYPAKTVAAIIGFVFGCLYRFSLIGYKPPKDCFNVHQFLQCIYYFQKNERLDKTMRLNTATVQRLKDLTEKQLSLGPNLVSSLKSTVKENLRGKIAAAIQDYETTDIEVLAAHVKGARAKYLWKKVGSRYTPLSVDESPHDELTMIPKFSLTEEHTEPKSLLRSPRQKNVTQKLLKKHYASPTSAGSLSQSEFMHLNEYLNPPSAQPGRSLAPSLMEGSDGTEDGETKSPHLAPPEPACQCRRVSDAMLLTNDDSMIPKCRPPTLRRTQSTSHIERLLFGWTFTAAVPRLYDVYNQALTLKDELVHHIDTNVQARDQLKRKLETHGASYTNENRWSDAIQYRISQSTRKEQAVKQQVGGLEALADKLDFQWTFLLHQVSEVEAAVQNFANKVDGAEKRWQEIEMRGRRRRWWWW